ncbi:MAG: glycosyltransferase, partial [Pseudomonadota bacterium]
IGVDVVGTIWDEDERAALAAPRVDYLGAMGHDALPALYRAALCVIVPNIETADGEYEGFGLVACEAAAAGGVVLAARRDGLLDAVIDGETGVLLPSGDAEAWRAAIADVASWPADRRRDFTARAMATARERYSWERASRDTVDVYREVLSG